jgi:hypothetical protein
MAPSEQSFPCRFKRTDEHSVVLTVLEKFCIVVEVFQLTKNNNKRKKKLQLQLQQRMV